ncbi:MAG: response regulator [Bacillota bacterium]
MKKKILVVDDEKSIRDLLRFNLEKEGYEPILVEDGGQVMDLLAEDQIDLIILDLMLPEIDGLTLCRKIKNEEAYNNIPIIMLTARSEEIDKVIGLEIGADDYVSKPFSIRELVARIRAVLRRSSMSEKKIDQQEQTTITSGDLQIDPVSYEVIYQGEKINLTPKEYEIIYLLVSNPGRVFSRDTLLNKIWGYDYYGDTRTVDVHIRRLRKKIDAGIIETVRGVGYKFVPLA